MRFDSGAIGLLDVNWLTPFKTRELTAVCAQGTYVANYLTQDLYFYENGRTTSEWDALSTFAGVAEGDMTRYRLRRVEPLRAELSAFCNAVLGVDAQHVNAHSALTTLEVTAALLRAAAEGRTIELASPTVS